MSSSDTLPLGAPPLPTYCYLVDAIVPAPLPTYLPTTCLLTTHLPRCQVRNLADAVVVYEQQYKLRYDKKELPVLQILADARYVLSVVKDKVRSE